MSSAAYDIATYLQTNGYGTVGVNIFVNLMDDSLNPSLGLRDYSGEPTTRTISGGKIEANPKVQALYRSQDSKSSYDALAAIHDFLDGKADVVVNGSRYMLITGMSEPVPTSRDEKGIK